MSEARVRRARPAEADELSELALRSKAHWGYDEAFMAASRAELKVTRAAVRDAGYYVAESEGNPRSQASARSRSIWCSTRLGT